MTWFLFSFLLLTVAVLLMIQQKQQRRSMYLIAPNDYGHLYNKGGAPTAPPPAGNIPSSGSAPQQAPPPPQPIPPLQQAPPPQPPAPKKPFSPIPLLLIAGVIFLFLGGIIFLTGTWDMLPDIARALSLLSASAIAFGINILAERVMKLPKTGLAFYILGCIFLPLALGGIGAFSLFGEWFSFYGDGISLLLALISFCVAATSFLGQSNYKSPILAWLGLTGAGGVWTFLCIFFTSQVLMNAGLSYAASTTILGALLSAFALVCTCTCEWYLRRHPIGETPLSKGWLPFLYLQNAAYLILMIVVSSDAPIAAFLFALVLAMLFLNERFISGRFHVGMPGFAAGMLVSLGSLCSADTFRDAGELEHFEFVTIGSILLLLSIASLPFLHKVTSGTMRIIAWVLSVAALPTTFIAMLIGMEHTGTYLLFLFLPLVIAAVQFAFTPKNPLAADTPNLLLSSMLLYCVCMGMPEDSLLLRLLLLGGALVLLAQAFLSRRFWPLALSICCGSSIALMGLENGAVWVTWLCGAALLAATVYAHIVRRPLLERCCAWAGLPFLLTASCVTFDLFLETAPAWVLTAAVLALVYLAELFLFHHHLRSVSMQSFSLNIAVPLYFAAMLSAVLDYELGIGWMILLALAMTVMSAGSLRRNTNLTALPMLIFLFVVMQDIISLIADLPHLTAGWSLFWQIACNLLSLLLFAGMGRLLLPHFCECKGSIMKIDWGLIVASFFIISVSNTINWYPSILSCLLLSVYSLLYIGRVKQHYIPTLLASAFGCLTIFFHNVHDPFCILEIWHEADFKAPQILLYLLPMHVFILTLLWILPKKFRNTVHMARFCMYCFTMLCLLGASLGFNHAVDGIVLAVFSFLILAGSFFVKRLRWFTLGFSVLFLMTVKLTWEFWQSLHWGIYLFLAGAVLLGIAFYYEYAVRRADKKNEELDELKEKINLFKEWKF